MQSNRAYSVLVVYGLRALLDARRVIHKKPLQKADCVQLDFNSFQSELLQRYDVDIDFCRQPPQKS